MGNSAISGGAGGGDTYKLKVDTNDNSPDFLDGKLDDFTLKADIINHKIKIADRIENNIMLAFFKISVNGGLNKYNLVDGIMDEFGDETGVDTAGSTNEEYDATDDFYKNYPDGTIDTNTKLLLHCDGINGGTTFTDSSPSANTVTPNNEVNTSTVSKKFGTASALFDGTTPYDYLTVPVNGTDWDLDSTASWTIDFWLSSTATQLDYAAILQSGDANSPYNGWSLAFDVPGSDKIRLINNANGLGGVTSSSNVPQDGWHHYAFVHDNSGDTLKLYIDGMEDASVTASTAIGWTNVSEPLYIGAQQGFLERAFKGYLDEVRISKGIARWTSNFTPDTVPYGSADAQDMILISNSTVAETTPSNSRIVVFEEDIEAITINTDLKAYLSRDGGTTYTLHTLIDEGDYDTGKRVLSTEAIDISAQPSGTSMKWKITTHNTKKLRLHAIGVNWD